MKSQVAKNTKSKIGSDGVFCEHLFDALSWPVTSNSPIGSRDLLFLEHHDHYEFYIPTKSEDDGELDVWVMGKLVGIRRRSLEDDCALETLKFKCGTRDNWIRFTDKVIPVSERIKAKVNVRQLKSGLVKAIVYKAAKNSSKRSKVN